MKTVICIICRKIIPSERWPGRFRLQKSKMTNARGHPRLYCDGCMQTWKIWDGRMPILETVQHADAGKSRIPADRSSERPHVCLRPTVYDMPISAMHGDHRIRRPVPAASSRLWRGSRHLCSQHHRCGDKINARAFARLSGPAPERGDPACDREDRDAVPRRCGGARLLEPTCNRRATENIARDDRSSKS